MNAQICIHLILLIIFLILPVLHFRILSPLIVILLSRVSE